MIKLLRNSIPVLPQKHFDNDDNAVHLTFPPLFIPYLKENYCLPNVNYVLIVFKYWLDTHKADGVHKILKILLLREINKSTRIQ